MSREFWDLVNITSRFGCCARARQAAIRIAKQRQIDIIVRFNGARANPNHDATRVNHWVRVDGSLHFNRGPAGEYLDVS